MTVEKSLMQALLTHMKTIQEVKYYPSVQILPQPPVCAATVAEGSLH